MGTAHVLDQTHWYDNLQTGQRFEPKTNFPRAENFWDGSVEATPSIRARHPSTTPSHLMRALLRRFGSVPLALAAYDAGPGAVERCGCIPPYPETRAYVARLLGLMGGAGALPEGA
jgi:hypothetical protein